MRRIWGVFVAIVIFLCAANAQITRTATFENYAPGTAFQPSFTDSLSGITFRNSTNPPYPGGFVVDGTADGGFFGGGNYLTAGAGPYDSLGAHFGFIADLPAAADRVSLEAIYDDDPITNIHLLGFDSSGHVVAEESGQAGMSNPFTLEIDSSQYNITTFQVSVAGGGAGYDNISYAYLPEPRTLLALIPLALSPYHRRR